MMQRIENLTALFIGRKLDGGVETVEIDIASWLEKYPQLTDYRIEVTAPNGIVYFPVVTMRENMLVWEITHGDTAENGKGSYQVVAEGKDGERKTSNSAVLNVMSIMPGTAQETPPAPSQPWVNQVMEAAEVAKEAAEEAKDALEALSSEVQDAVQDYLEQNPPQGVSDEHIKDVTASMIEEAKASGEFDGKDGVDGKDGYTPVKGVDYFDGVDGKDGKDGADGKDGTDANVTAKNIANALGFTPENYTLPPATADTLGGVMVGDGLTVDAQGVVGVTPEQRWETIKTITVTEEGLKQIVENQLPDGTPYNLSAAKVIWKFFYPISYTYGVEVIFRNNGERIGAIVKSITKNAIENNQLYATFIAQMKPVQGVYEVMGAYGSIGAEMQLFSPPNGGYQAIGTELHIDEIILNVWSDDHILPVGTTIEIIGVRADA